MLQFNHSALAAGLLLGSCFAALPVHAAAIQLFGAADLGAPDITLTYPGIVNALISSPLTVVTTANTVTFVSPFGSFRHSAQGAGFNADFLPSTPVLVPQSSSYLDIIFGSGITEAGLQVQSGYVSSLPSRETLTAYNGSTTLGSWTISTRNNGAGDGSAPFLGVRTTEDDVITRLRVSNRVGVTELDYYFGIGPLTFATLPLQPVPEPAPLLLFAFALPFCALSARRVTAGQRARNPVAENGRRRLESDQPVA
ncbi:MAG: hypothetical protein M3Z09_06325 [Acidobacteriota bacterium]|nr:hypothetical protein [Acidobacteriota bacterium]